VNRDHPPSVLDAIRLGIWALVFLGFLAGAGCAVLVMKALR
jgi:hypothetical protein